MFPKLHPKEYDIEWRKSRLAARLLVAASRRDLNAGRRALAAQLAGDHAVTNRLIKQALAGLYVRHPQQHLVGLIPGILTVGAVSGSFTLISAGIESGRNRFMSRTHLCLPRYLRIATAVLILSGCSRLTPENFEKIKVGMTVDQVKAILGNPDDIATQGALGLTSSTFTYKHGASEIKIVFLNNEVLAKSDDVH